ncbi:hypothetical protein NYA10_29765, partial [Burkholderia thailandensis]|nr:hypothetical protein [Burkholderia thailandensis]
VREFEPIVCPLSRAGLLGRQGVDRFARFPLTTADGARLREAGLRWCPVSAELLAGTDEHALTKMQGELADRGIAIDAVCTKRPDLWEGSFAS